MVVQRSVAITGLSLAMANFPNPSHTTTIRRYVMRAHSATYMSVVSDCDHQIPFRV